MQSIIKRFQSDEAGATSIEYALIAVLISTFVIIAMSSVGTQVSNLFRKVETTVSTASTLAK
jgi:pilus assembly protein Flp/PilA